MHRITSLIIMPLLAATPAYAEDAATDPAQSTGALQQVSTADDSIIVTANRSTQPRDRVGQAVSVIDTAEIERRQSSVVSDLLREVPGVTVTRNGGVGTVTAVNIRGAETDQTVALIDGIKLNDPAAPGGGFDFGQLLTGNIARVEVLRGAQSVLWGSQAIGGVVNLITRQPTEHLAVNARAEGGSFATGQAFGNVSDKVGPLSLSAGGGWYRTDGTPIAVTDTKPGGYRNYAANGSANFALTEAISLDLRGYYADSRTDFDGFPPPNYALANVGDYQLQRQALGYAGLNVALFGGRLHNRFGYALTDTRRRNLNRNPAQGESFRSAGRNARLDYQGVVDLGMIGATFGAEHEVSRYTTSSYGGAPAIARTRIDSVYGQLIVTPVRGLTLTGGARHDDHSLFGGVTTTSASGVWSPNGGGTTLRASYSEGFKAPTLYQLQSEYGNVLLRPERSKGWDAGIAQKLLGGAITAEATWFHRNSHDLITFISCLAQTGICANRPYGTYDNVLLASAEGLETALTVKPNSALSLQATYTYVDARNRTPGTAYNLKLARRPSQSLTLLADYRWHFGLETGVTVTNIGPSFDNAANTTRLAGYTLVDMRASLPVTHKVALYGRIENLFDEHYQTTRNYAQPGRAAYAGVRISY